MFPVFTSGVEVFAVQPKPPPIGDALSLAELAQTANHRPSEATLRTREKIGLGKTKFWMMQNPGKMIIKRKPNRYIDYLVTDRHSFLGPFHGHIGIIIITCLK